MTSPAVTADLASLRAQVTPENVLLLHNGLKAEAKFLNTQLRNFTFRAKVGKPGNDPVSEQAANVFNAKINRLSTEVGAYIAALDEMAEAMAGIAKSYGHTEDQITASFTRFNSSYAQNAAASTFRR